MAAPNGQTFRTIEWAMNYAEGQRMRLGLEHVEIPVPSTPNEEPGEEELDDEQEPADKSLRVRPGRAPAWAIRHAATDAAAQRIIDDESVARIAKAEHLRDARLASKDRQTPRGSKPTATS